MGDKPILVSYGTSLSNGENISPFVFNNGAGADPVLGNEDGCIKLVYDPNEMTMLPGQNADYTLFGNMAYIYVEEGDPPGYKHNTDPYQSPDISNYVLTVTGENIGREVNYTVSQLEDMVEYGDSGAPDNSGMGYRDEYSLANSTYWYVNEYEGVQLWKLLLRSGLDPSYANDEETIVSSTATDGYAATDKFTTAQVADPDRFGFYEKNPADLNDGTYEGNENIREGDDVSTGDKLRIGYPVLVAYGVNGYPYVEKATQDGYLSGLQNDGGPLRIISGKIQYNHANGSNQAKLLDKVLVGPDTYHYSTHKYHSNPVYTGMADDTLEIKIVNGSGEDAPVLKDVTYKVGDIEELIYGGSLTRTQLAEAMIKTFYQLTKGTNAYSDLYEGIDLNWFLRNIVELPGYKGTISFSNGTTDIAFNLEEVLSTSNGSNTETGMEGLSPVLAYGKNGYPMVVDKDSQGYKKNDILAAGTDYENEVTVKNDGGPLAVLFPHTDTGVSDKSMTNVKTITVNLSADQYAHISEPYNSYQDDVITISGAGTRLTEAKDFTVAELEGKQTIAYTGDYSILNNKGTKHLRYRGIKLYSLLTSSAVGLKSNADKVIVRTTDGTSMEYTLSEIRKADYINTITGANDLPVILAYGVGIAGTDDKEVGIPLVADKNSEGYVADYDNFGGPVRFVMGQTDAEDQNNGKNLKYVSSIEVTASEMTSWNHSVSEVYKQYLNETINLSVVDREGNELYNKDYTVEEIEANTDLIERITATVVQEYTWEGVNFWQFVLQEVGNIPGVSDPVTIDVTAADGFSKEVRSIFGLDALNNGIKDGEKYIPIIMAYGVGGSPLVIGDKSHANGEGYDATVGNNGGPIRLITHNNQGASLTYVKKIKVTVGESAPPAPAADFVIKGLDSGDIELNVEDIANIKNSAGDVVGQAQASYTSKKSGTETVKGAYLKDILAAYGIDTETATFTVNTTDAYEATETSYQNILVKDAIDQKYFVAYAVKNEDGTWSDIADSDNKDNPEEGNISAVRIYRKYNEELGNDPAVDWRNRCTSICGITVNVPEKVVFKEYPTTGIVRSTWMDKDGNLWAGTDGGGLYEKKAGADGFIVYNTSSEPALLTAYTTAVAADADGGIWVSQNHSYLEAYGVIYMKDGEITQYTAEDDPQTIPQNYVQVIKIGSDGRVWLATFAGLTIYDPADDSWTTYTKDNTPAFPATSVCAITLDEEGGAWLGFYPDGTGTEEDPWTSGFCYMASDGTVSKVTTLTGVTDPKFAECYVRSIAIDQKGTVWVTAAGTNLEDNVGGTVFKIKAGSDSPDNIYTGKEIFADYINGSSNAEVRMVTVAPDGSLWFGTSADGILVVDNPKLNSEGKMDVTAQYAKETGSWSASNMNNVYSINFWNNGTVYVGSSGGVQVLGDEPEAQGGDEKEVIGDATEETADFKVTGDGAAKLGYFTIRGLKNAEGLVRTNASYSWQNSSGSTGVMAFEGVYLDNLLKDVIGLTDKAATITVKAGDGKSKELELSAIDIVDRDGNKPMIAWKSDQASAGTLSNIDPQLVIGQSAEGEVNRRNWLSNVVEIRVDEAESGGTDKTQLEEALTQAQAAKDAVKVSADGSDVKTNEKWVTQDVMDALDAAIADATEVLENENASSEDVAAAVTALNEAVSAFNDAKQDGTDETVEKEVIGGETEETAALIVDGDGTVKTGYFSIKSLKNAENLVRTDATYRWQNSSGSTGSNTFQGVYLDNLFRDVIGLTDNAITFTVIAKDGYSKTFDISMIDTVDLDANKPMIAWQSDEDPANTKIDPKLVIGQSAEGEANKGKWIKNVHKIIVKAADAPTPKTFEVTGVIDKPYTGKAVTQDLVVKSDDTVLTEGTDYEVVYKNNVKPGSKAEFMVTGKGEYQCTVTGTFRVLFKDVPANHSYANAIYWLADEGIGAGYSGKNTGLFGPSDSITRGQVVMFIWKAAGKPEPSSTKQRFSDVDPSNNFFKAIQWAAEKKITAGYSSGPKKGTFGYKENCTRGQIVTFLLRYIRLTDPSAGPISTKQQFSDVPTDHGFYQAVQWAYENNITKGYTSGAKKGTFGVSENCTRGQCATFLYRALK